MVENLNHVFFEFRVLALLWHNYDIKTKSCATWKAVDADLFSISLHLQYIFGYLGLFL